MEFFHLYMGFEYFLIEENIKFFKFGLFSRVSLKWLFTKRNINRLHTNLERQLSNWNKVLF